MGQKVNITIAIAVKKELETATEDEEMTFDSSLEESILGAGAWAGAGGKLILSKQFISPFALLCLVLMTDVAAWGILLLAFDLEVIAMQIMRKKE